MKTGVFIFPTDYSIDITELAVALEERGFEALFVPEHTHIPTSRRSPFPAGGPLQKRYAHTHDPFIALSFAAAATKNLTIGTGICLLAQRDPIVTAKVVASLDRLSGGRVTLGVGRGYSSQLLGAFSVSPKDKRRIFEWCLDHMIRAWRGEPVALTEGAEPVIVAPLPVQQPHPPIWVAAFGPKALAQAGRLGAPLRPHRRNRPGDPVDRFRETRRLLL